MIKNLIVLADKLDSGNHKEAANFIDSLIKKVAKEDEEWVTEPTKPGADPAPSTLTPLAPQSWEPGLKGQALVSKLRETLQSLPNPEKWTSEECIEIRTMLEDLAEQTFILPQYPYAD